MIRYCKIYVLKNLLRERVPQKLLKHGYVALRLMSSLQIFYGRHRELVDRYEISIS
jgi:hypothetical protein